MPNILSWILVHHCGISVLYINNYILLIGQWVASGVCLIFKVNCVILCQCKLFSSSNLTWLDLVSSFGSATYYISYLMSNLMTCIFQI